MPSHGEHGRRSRPAGRISPWVMTRTGCESSAPAPVTLARKMFPAEARSAVTPYPFVSWVATRVPVATPTLLSLSTHCPVSGCGLR